MITLYYLRISSAGLGCAHPTSELLMFTCVTVAQRQTSTTADKILPVHVTRPRIKLKLVYF